MRIVNSSEMRSIDKEMQNRYSLSPRLLMENAACAVASYISSSFEKRTKILFITGSGNNGGDGLAAARMLFVKGYCVTVITTCPENKMHPLALENYNLAVSMGICCVLDADINVIEHQILLSDVIVDSIFGTGLTGCPSEKISDIITYVNNSEKVVVSIDVPSGINADTGEIYSSAIKAETLITLGAIKQGLLLFPAKECYKQLIVEEISIPAGIYNDLCAPKFTFCGKDIAKMLKPRQNNSHKGNYGRLGIISGSAGMTGAACLAAESALKMGAGLISLAVPSSLNAIFETKLTEQMTCIMPECKGSLIFSDELMQFTANKDAILVGPGIGRTGEITEIICSLLKSVNCALILDADALFAISECAEVLRDAQCPVIITPHVGEAARILKISSDEICTDLPKYSKILSSTYNVTCVLKSAVTAISSPSGELILNTSGTNGMATGGSGDVLAGVISSLSAQGYTSIDSAVIGTYINGSAAEAASQILGDSGMTPSDTCAFLPQTTKELYDMRNL